MKWLRGFVYAWEGFVYALRTQRNMKFHTAAALVAVLASIYAGLEPLQWLWVLLAIALVWSAELMNTAVEQTVDLVSKGRSETAKRAKDTAAAAVLVVSVFAVAVAIFVLLPALWQRLNGQG